MTPPRRLITPADAQRLLSVPRSTFWDLARAKKLTVVHLTAKCKRVYEDEILALIAKSSVKAGGDLRQLADARRA